MKSCRLWRWPTETLGGAHLVEMVKSRAVGVWIDWTWSESDKASLPEPVVRLTGTTLAWFFTSSNRFLRDRATGACETIRE